MRSATIVTFVGLMLLGACTGDVDQRRAADGSARRMTSTSRPMEAPTGSAVPGSQRADATAAVDAELEAIEQALREAQTPEERAEAQRRWEEWNEANPGPRTMSEDPGRERITWSEALEWWPYRPLLRARPIPTAATGGEVIHAISRSGGRKGDPRRESAGVEVVYQTRGATTDSEDYFGVIDGGGITVTVMFVPGDVPAFSDASPTDDAREVEVRGRQGVLVNNRRPHVNVDWRVLRWREPLADGAFLRWTVGNHPDLYTDEETIRFANRLDEVR